MTSRCPRKSDARQASYTYDALDRVIERVTEVASGPLGGLGDPGGLGGLDLDPLVEGDSEVFTYAGVELDPVSIGDRAYSRTPSGELLAVDDGTTALLVGENRHGDLAWLANPASGTVTDTRVWDPWGDTAGTTGSADPAVGFQGDYTDPHSSMVWMGARWYQPGTATFASRDTVTGALGSPVTLNRYTYANNDPLEYVDPDGQFGMPSFVKRAVRSVTRHVSRGVSTVRRTTRSAYSTLSRHVFRPIGRALSSGYQAARSVMSTAVRAGSRVGSAVAGRTVSAARAIGRGAATVGRVVATPIRACAGSSACRTAVTGAAVVAGAVLCSACTAAVLTSSAIGGGIGLATCDGDIGCVARSTIAGGASGFGGAGLGGVALGAFTSGAADQVMSGKFDARQLATATATGLGTGIAGRAIGNRLSTLTTRTRGLSAPQSITNPVPQRLARVVDADFAGSPRLGGPGADRVFVTAADDIAGISTSRGLAERLTLLDDSFKPRSGPFAVIEFDAPMSGLGSPVFRSNPGFVGFGRTAGGAREFDLPNMLVDDLFNVSRRTVL